MKEKWQGQRLRWNVLRHRALCQTEEACNVAPFPVQRPAQYGWMPRVTLTAGELAKLETACANQDPCAITIEGTLAHLDVTGDAATKLTFTDVNIVSTRESATLARR